jgi:hypothetical protein
MQLINGLPEEKLEKRIAKFIRISSAGDRCLGFYLLDFNARGLFRKRGFSSTAQYALIEHRIPKRKTRELLRISRALEELPLIDEAFSKGRLSWSAVRELTRIATPETEREWLGTALESSLTEIERLVSRVKKGERPPKDPYGLAKTKIKVIGEFELDDLALVQAAIDLESQARGASLDASTAILSLAKYRLEHASEEGKEERKKKSGDRLYQVVYHRCNVCDAAWYETGDGPIGVAANKVDGIEREANVIRIDDGTARPDGAALGKDDPCGSFLSTVNTPPVVEVERDRPNTPRIRQQVMSRDGHCCAVPGCENKGALMSHHVKWRMHGGPTMVENEVCVCQSCHSLIHEGLLLVKGNAPHGLQWFDADGEPLGGREKTKELARFEYTTRQDTGSHIPGRTDNTTIYSLDEVPSEIDSAWWRKYGHNFEIKGKRLVLKMYA